MICSSNSCDVYESRDRGDPVNYVGQLTFDDKVIESPEMPKTAINDGPLKKAMQEMGVKAPLGEIRGQSRSAFGK